MSSISRSAFAQTHSPDSQPNFVEINLKSSISVGLRRIVGIVNMENLSMWNFSVDASCIII